MKFVKVQDEERPGEVAINLDLVREAHFGGGLLRLYFEQGASQDASPLPVKTRRNCGRRWDSVNSLRANTRRRTLREI